MFSLTKKNGRRVLLPLSSIAFLFLVGCSSIKVQSDYDERASFAQLKTYDWVDRPFEAGGNPAVNSALGA